MSHFIVPSAGYGVPVSLHPQHVVFYFLIIAIPVVGKWFLTMVLICISLMTNNVEHLFMCLWLFSLLSFREMSTQVLWPFLFELFVFLTLLRRIIYEYFYSLCRLAFYFLGNVLESMKNLI